MNEKKTKPRELTPTVKRLIYQRAINERQVPREYLANSLIKEITEAGEIPPTLEVTKRYISKARNSSKYIDEPWTIGACSEFNAYFPPESISFLVECIQFFIKPSSEYTPKEIEFEKKWGHSPYDFSIRVCMWIVRLKPLIDKIYADQISKVESARIGLPVSIATIYALAEMTSEIMDEDHFNTADLDASLISQDLNSFASKAGCFVRQSAKEHKCDLNCESCKYEKSGIGNLCHPKRKEGVK